MLITSPLPSHPEFNVANAYWMTLSEQERASIFLKFFKRALGLMVEHHLSFAVTRHLDSIVESAFAAFCFYVSSGKRSAGPESWEVFFDEYAIVSVKQLTELIDANVDIGSPLSSLPEFNVANGYWLTLSEQERADILYLHLEKALSIMVDYDFMFPGAPALQNVVESAFAAFYVHVSSGQQPAGPESWTKFFHKSVLSSLFTLAESPASKYGMANRSFAKLQESHRAA